MNEQQRQQTLDRLNVLDSPTETFFNAIVAAAKVMTGLPIGLVSLIDHDRQWFKAVDGLEGPCETPRDVSFCKWVVASGALMEVADTLDDPRFASNPFVVSAPFIRHYVGAPLTIEGQHVGTLCLLGTEPGRLSVPHRMALVLLAQAVAEGLTQRAALLARVEEASGLHEQLARSEAFLERTNAAARVGGWELDIDSGRVSWTRETRNIHQVGEDFEPTLQSALAFYAQADQLLVARAIEKCIEDGTPVDLQARSHTATGRPIWVHVIGQRDSVGGHAHVVGAVKDISDQRDTTEALERSESKYRRLFQYSMGLICTHDMEGTLTSVNPAATRSLGYAEDALIGRGMRSLMPEARGAGFDAYLARIVENQTDSGVLELIAADGSKRYWAYHNVLDEQGDPPYVLGHAQDITTQHQQEQQLVELAVRDPLTRCYNRRYLGQLAEQQLEIWGCLVFDLDHFKQINDNEGHAQGDAVLIAFAAFLQAPLREGEVVVRLGGDEFLIFVPDANRSRLEALESRYQQCTQEAPVGFTLGCAVSRPGESVADTINRADGKLYARRNRVRAATRQA